MGIFAINIQVARPTSRPAFAEIRRVMVDTGSEMTWLSGEKLQKLGVWVRKKDQPFIMANGERVTRDVGYAIIRSGDFETIDEVVFARRGDLQLLGARTLEGFNAVVDPRRKRLVAAGPMPAARASARAGCHSQAQRGPAVVHTFHARFQASDLGASNGPGMPPSRPPSRMSDRA